MTLAVQAVGAGAGALEQFGRTIDEFQAIEHKLAEMATNAEAARSLTYRAASEVEAGDQRTAMKFASTALVIGADAGIRRATAPGLAGEGAHVIVTDIDNDRGRLRS